jgi:hypothetical protein
LINHGTHQPILYQRHIHTNAIGFHGHPGAGTDARKTFEAAFTTDMAKLLGNIDKSRIRITSIKAGSIIVNFYILADSAGKPLPYKSLTTAFKEKGVSIGGAQSTAVITSDAISTTTAQGPAPEPVSKCTEKQSQCSTPNL